MVRGWGVRENTTGEKPQKSARIWSLKRGKWRRASDDKNDFDRVVNRLVTTYFASNLSNWCEPGDLWAVFKSFGCMIDAFVPRKKAASGRKFAFVRFKNACDPLLLENQLDGLWISTFKLHVNLARYQNNPR